MSAVDVIAVVGPADAATAAACHAALEASRPAAVADVVTGLDGLASAAARGTHVWVLATAAAPRPDALAELLEAAGHDPAPALVAGLVVGADGRPAAEVLPAGREADTADVIALARRRVLPIRRSSLASTLVAADVVAAWPPPDPGRYGRYADQVWTAQVLRERTGVFVPASVAVATAPPAAPSPRDLLPALRASRTGTWTRGETVRALALAARTAR